MKKEYRYNHKGLYKVGSKAFTNKFEACLELNTIPGDHHLHWDYHEDLFSKANWEHEPPVSILELYKQRALQLREQYDHLVLFYSGGADSHTILQAFINNNIKLDEVFMYGSIKAEEEVNKKIGFDLKEGYYTRELFHIALPVLKELQKTHKFKLTVWDWTDRTLEVLKDPDWFWSIGDLSRLAPDALPRNYFHEALRHNDIYEDRGKKVAFIFGLDKPRLFRDNHSIYLAFIDITYATGVGNNAGIEGRNWGSNEYFYWSPNMPEIPVKQAHMIYNFLKKTNGFNKITHINQLGGFHNSEYYKMIHPIIYPQWNQDIWQINKPTSNITNTSKWFFDSAKTKETKKQWFAGIKEVERQLGGRHFNNNSVMSGLTGCYSKFYKIADISADSSRITVDSDRTL